LEQGVQDLLGAINKRIVYQAAEALAVGDAEQLGALMVEAQGFFDCYALPACPEELTAPVLHRALSHEALRPHVWGGKGVGSQGDGAAQFVARSKAAQQAAVEILERELGMSCLTVTLHAAPQPAKAHAAAELAQREAPALVAGGIPPVRKAVIPAAGLVTRLFPATQAIKKEFFPIVDQDGIVKPAILLIIEEAMRAGIEEVILVIQDRDRETFQSFFDVARAADRFGKLPASLQDYGRRIAQMRRHVSFAAQASQEGFGHAVYSARQAVGSEPFLLMLGDHLYQSENTRSCARQLLEAYGRTGRSVLGLRRVQEHEVVHYGTACGQWLEKDRLLEAAQFVEKPEVDYARSHLRVPGLPEAEYLAFFGQYVIKPRVFDFLEERIVHGRREWGEFQLTSALEDLRQEDGFLGLVIDGRCYDIGLPESYLQTLQAFGPEIKAQGGGE
jgi:UTP-glucose-1-phosphate uridylyltransferase